jgi:Fe-S cluster biogenesis protein NfuA
MDNIQIRGDVDKQDANICRFTVDRPVYSGSAAFSSKEEAQQHPLAEKLFKIPGIVKTEFADNVVTLTKDSFDQWNVIGKRIGGSIRSYLQPPQAPEGDTLPSEIVRDKVQRLLDEMINPNLAMHGGFVELLDVENNNIYVRMGGGCQGCGAADMTMRMGIERMIREEVPQIGEVLDVTDHAAGQNPYYAPQK